MVQKCFALSTHLPYSGISSLLVKIPQITSYIASHIQVEKAIRGKFFLQVFCYCGNMKYNQYALAFDFVRWLIVKGPGRVRFQREVKVLFGSPSYFTYVTCRLALFQKFMPCFRWFWIVCEWLQMFLRWLQVALGGFRWFQAVPCFSTYLVSQNVQKSLQVEQISKIKILGEMKRSRKKKY